MSKEPVERVEINPAALRAFRTAKKLSQYALSHRSKVPEGTIAPIETGRKASVPIDVAERLAEGVGVPVEAILAQPGLIPNGCEPCPTCEGRGYQAMAVASMAVAS